MAATSQFELILQRIRLCLHDKQDFTALSLKDNERLLPKPVRLPHELSAVLRTACKTTYDQCQ